MSDSEDLLPRLSAWAEQITNEAAYVTKREDAQLLDWAVGEIKRLRAEVNLLQENARPGLQPR